MNPRKNLGATNTSWIHQTKFQILVSIPTWISLVLDGCWIFFHNHLGWLLLFYYFGTTQVININIKSNTTDYWFTWFFWIICACVRHYVHVAFIFLLVVAPPKCLKRWFQNVSSNLHLDMQSSHHQSIFMNTHICS